MDRPHPRPGRHRAAAYDEGTPTAGWDHAVPVLELILGTALGMAVTVIATSLTLAETAKRVAGL